jgi:hypothetical protein
MKILENKSDAMVKYKEELLGSGTDFRSPDLYNEMELGKEVAGTYLLFLKQPIRMQAKLIAQHYLSNMVEIVKRHDRLQRQKLEKYNKGK